jgi:hypothetical protein
LIFQHFRSENIKLFVRKKKNVMFFCQHFQWIRLYDVEIKMQLSIFEIFMHSIKINIFVFYDDHSMTIVIKTLINAKRREYQNWLRKKLSTWNDWRKSFSTKMNKLMLCWNSSSSRRSTQSFNDISSETTKFTRAKDFFVIAKSSNVIIVDDMITSKINVFRF